MSVAFFYWIIKFVLDTSEFENDYEHDEAESDDENDLFEESEPELLEESKLPTNITIMYKKNCVETAAWQEYK